METKMIVWSSLSLALITKHKYEHICRQKGVNNSTQKLAEQREGEHHKAAQSKPYIDHSRKSSPSFCLQFSRALIRATMVSVSAWHGRQLHVMFAHTKPQCIVILHTNKSKHFIFFSQSCDNNLSCNIIHASLHHFSSLHNKWLRPKYLFSMQSHGGTLMIKISKNIEPNFDSNHFCNKFA